MASDNELILRIRNRDREALSQLYARYSPAVWRYALARLRPDESAARDAVSETFLAAMRDMQRLDLVNGSVAGWLLGIARHKVTDALRRRTPTTNASVDSAIAANMDPGQPLADAETQRAIAEVLTALDEEQRMALEWKYVEMLSVKEIAQRLGRSEKAAEAFLFRAREAFKERYQAMLNKQENRS